MSSQASGQASGSISQTVFSRLRGRIGAFNPGRALVGAVLIALALSPGEIGTLTRAGFADAFTGVSVFVAATLMLVYGTERLFKFDLGQALQNVRRAQVPVAALMGMTPGCAGAVMVAAAYSAGNVSMGALVAALTATMGDAAFLLIATKPEVALVVLPLSLVVGTLSGYLVDIFHTKHFPARTTIACDIGTLIGSLRRRDIAFGVLAGVGLIGGLADAFRIPLPGLLGDGAHDLALMGAFVALIVWAFSPMQAMSNPADAPITRVTEETSFITVWVLTAYLAFSYVETFAGLDLAALFASVGPLLPMIGIGIGFIPGCGPQVLVTTMYINGLVPFSALIGNALANDGDALFPAIALNPRAAFVATIYSAIPAIVVAYAFYFLAPGFMN